MSKALKILKSLGNIYFIVLATAIIGVISAKGLLSKFEMRFYDFMLGQTREIPSYNDIVLVDIEDISMAKIGAWPWPRDILGDMLIRMKELGARQAVFDIEYLSPATKAVEENLEEKIKSNFSGGQDAITSSIMAFSDDVAKGTVNKGNAHEEGENLAAEISNNVLYEMMRDITSGFNKDNDEYFAKAIQFFGNVSLTINTRNIAIQRSDEEIEYAQERFLFSNVSDPYSIIDRGNDFSAGEEEENAKRGFVPALQKICSKASGAGFTNVVVDRDGIRRRVELLNHHDGKYTGQLSFAPLVKLLGAESMERTRNSLIVRGMTLPGSEGKTDIKIPLDPHGRMLINWLKTGYDESFTHVPVYMLYNLDRAEELVISNLMALADSTCATVDGTEVSKESLAKEYSGIMSAKRKLLSKCRGFDIEGNAVKGGISDEDRENYFARRKKFFSSLKEFASAAKATELESNLTPFLRDWQLLEKTLANGFCFIGNSATASTDLGVTPFTKRYPNLGTHANVANTIIQQQFITEIPSIAGIIFTLIVILVILGLTFNKQNGRKIFFGTIYVFLPTLIFFCAMKYFRIYIPVAAPFILALLIFSEETFVNFRKVNKNRKFLQQKFGAYVSPEVVQAMQKNPELAELGAQNKYMTALFSDVKTFSGFTETLNNELGEEKGAVELQKILSDYLGYLTKAIMGQQGTVDKFVGDEIVSFFNAPLDDEEHAYHACVAGIRMLQAEAEYNRLHESTLPINKATGKPFLLNSRVGLNTGYMAVGNMGTADKMNYTVMGNSVNLASRLEGTNKVYGSWIMCSESTWESANSGSHKGELIARMFDCVRVINVKKPVQLYNILGLRNELPKEQIESAEVFNEGIKWYLKGNDTPELPKDREDFMKAIECFEKAKALYPADESSQVFIDRCKNFLESGIPEIWDGVYTMKSK